MKYSCNACGRYVEGSCDCHSPVPTSCGLPVVVDYFKAQEIADQFNFDYNLVCRILRAYLED